MKNEERTKKDFKGLYGVYQSSARIVIGEILCDFTNYYL